MTVKLDTLKLDQLIATNDAEASLIVRSFAFQVEGTAKESMTGPSPSDPGSPPAVVTGALKNSVMAEEKDGPLNWWVHDGVEYGIWLCLGTSRMAARPFMVPAVENHRQAWEDAWRKFLQR